MNIIENLTKKYNLAPNSYLKQSIWKGEVPPASQKRYEVLQSKWKHKIGAGWYGFDMTSRLSIVFYNVIDEFLDWVNKENPDFEIHQIKQKFNNIRIHLGNINKETS